MIKIIIKRGKQAMQNTIVHHPLTHARLLFPKPDWSLFWVTRPSFYSGHDPPWYRMPLWSIQVTCPSYGPLQFPLSSSSLAEYETRKKTLDLG